MFNNQVCYTTPQNRLCLIFVDCEGLILYSIEDAFTSKKSKQLKFKKFKVMSIFENSNLKLKVSASRAETQLVKSKISSI